MKLRDYGLFLIPLFFWLVFFVLIPPAEGPDEGDHYAYVQSMAYLKIPHLGKSIFDYDYIYSPEEKNLLSRFHQFDIKLQPNYIYKAPLPKDDSSKGLSDSVDLTAQSTHPPVYYFIASIFYNAAKLMGLSPLMKYYVTRFASLLCYAILLLFAYKSFVLFFDRKTSRMLTLVIALQPNILFLSNSVNPENGLIALSAASAYCIAYVLKRRLLFTKKIYGVFLGFLAALTFLSKVTGVIILPIFIGSLIFMTKKKDIKKAVYAILLFLATFALVVSPWFMLNYLWYHNLLPDNFFIIYKGSPPHSVSMTMLAGMILADLHRGFTQFPVHFGWLGVSSFRIISYAYSTLLFFSLFLGILAFFKTKKKNEEDRLMIVYVTYAVSTILFFVAFSYRFTMQYWDTVLQGRHLLVGWLPFLLVGFYGLRRFVAIDQYKLIRYICYLSVWFLLTTIVFLLIPRYYV